MDIFPAEKRSKVMRSIRSKDTGPEMAIRKELHSRGYRYRLHISRLPGRPDIVFTKYRVAVQIRGCFWHGHKCSDGHIPKTHIDYWQNKISSNQDRDRRNDRLLRKQGWSLLCIWECECSSQKRINIQIGRIEKAIERRLNR